MFSNFAKILFLAIFGLSLVGAVSAEQSEQRFALVIGNSAYSSVLRLDNPVHDAELMAKTLKEQGFKVALKLDAAQIEMKRAIADFGRELRAAGTEATGLFYYAGHGVQSFGNNYLLPVDATLQNAADLDLVAVEAQSVLRQMASARNRTNLVILDACRDNPFEHLPDLNENGLAEMKAPTGTFLAYATAPGGVALDGIGGNSPFTAEVARQISIPGLPIEQAFKEVRRAVLEQSQGRQTPWDTSSLVSDFVFVAAPEEPVLTAAEVEELQLWRSVEHSRDPVQLMLFLRGYPQGRFSDTARLLLAEVMEEELSGNRASVAQAPQAPEAAEKAMFDAAQAEASVAAYQSYLQAYPDGVYAEMARIEIDALGAATNTDPVGEGTQTSALPSESADQPLQRAKEMGPITFHSPLATETSEINGRSLEEIIALSPAFPPIEGLPESYWKDQTCGSCHEWTRERLCTQANTYLSLNMQRSLSKQHPFGGELKRSLKSWAAGGCQ